MPRDDDRVPSTAGRTYMNTDPKQTTPGTRRRRLLTLAMLCGTLLFWAAFASPAHAASPSAASATDATRTSAAAPIIVKFHNRLTGKCLSTNWTYTPYTATCSTAEGQRWDIAGTGIRNLLTGKCLSTNWTYSAYTATCNSAADGQKWIIFSTAPYVQNVLTGKCLSANWSDSVYTATWNTAADGQKWDLEFL